MPVRFSLTGRIEGSAQECGRREAETSLEHGVLPVGARVGGSVGSIGTNKMPNTYIQILHSETGSKKNWKKM